MLGPKNGAYYDKDELQLPENLAGSLDPAEDAKMAIDMLYDVIALTPPDTLLLLVANRLNMVKPDELTCEMAAGLASHSKMLGQIGRAVHLRHLVACLLNGTAKHES